MTSGSVRPCPTSVTRMTVNVRKTTSSRPGTGRRNRSRRAARARRERDRAAHPRPREEHRAARVGHPAHDPLRRVVDDEHPRESQQDHRQADERGVAEEPGDRDVVERVDDHGELEPDEDEQERVEEVLDDLPDGERLQPTCALVSSGVCQPR